MISRHALAIGANQLPMIIGLITGDTLRQVMQVAGKAIIETLFAIIDSSIGNIVGIIIVGVVVPALSLANF